MERNYQKIQIICILKNSQLTHPFVNMSSVKRLQSQILIGKIRREQYLSAQMKIDYTDVLWKVKTKYWLSQSVISWLS